MNLGPAEILVVLFVALLVFGPKRLPDVARQVGGAVRELRKMQDHMKAELQGVMEPVVDPDAGPSEAIDGTPPVEAQDHTALPQGDPSADAVDDPFRGPSDSFS